MSYVKNFLLPEDDEQIEGPGLEDEIQSILQPLYNPHPTNRDITYQLVELVKTESMDAYELATRLDVLVEYIVSMQTKVRRLLPVEFRKKEKWL